MSELNLLLGPAVIAAVISGLVSFLVVQLNFRQERRAAALQREEKVRDFQIALRAEIASDLSNMQRFDRAKLLQSVADAMVADPLYTPVIPRLSANTIFGAIIADLPLLPARVIAPVVDYERLRQSLGQLVEDLRANSHKELPADRRLLAYADYVATYDLLEEFAGIAVRALEESLPLSRTGAGRLDYPAAKDEAFAGNSPS